MLNHISPDQFIALRMFRLTFTVFLNAVRVTTKSGYPPTTNDLWPGAVTLNNPCLLPNIYHLKSIWLLEVQISAKCQFNCQLTYCSVAIEPSVWATDNFNTSRLTECRCEKHMLFENKNRTNYFCHCGWINFHFHKMNKSSINSRPVRKTVTCDVVFPMESPYVYRVW